MGTVDDDKTIRASSTARAVAAMTAVTVALFLLVEGVASTFLASLDAARQPQSTLFQYDSLLGWVSVPSLHVENVWGRGRDVDTNREGFRNHEDTRPSVTPGRIRVVCSGDSFTFGEGVGNDDTWCARLATLDERLEPVDLGESGYGIDQAFLRYRRDAAPLQHQIHVFAFIGDDLNRIVWSQVWHSEPRFRLVDDSLVLTNVPVPTVGPSLFRFVQHLSAELRSVEFLARSLDRFHMTGDGQRPLRSEEIEPIAARLFQHVAQLSATRGSVTFFVYLPVSSELDGDGPWRGRVRDLMRSTGYPFIDLTDSLRALPQPVVRDFFIRADAGGGGHYSEVGHAWVADMIYDAMRAHPATAPILADPSGTEEPSEPPAGATHPAG